MFPPPRHAEPNEIEGYIADATAFAEAWVAFMLDGLTLGERRAVLQSHTERLRALAQIRSDGT